MNRDELKVRAVEVLGSGVLTGLGATLRYTVSETHHYAGFREAGRPVIFIFWHSRLLPLVHLHRGQGVVALVSHHRDGEYIARVIRRRGFEAARGSSTRGGSEALRDLVRWARKGRDIGITPDGPKGPARRLKLGAVTLGRITGLPLVPAAAAASRAWRARSWDRFVVPAPFARIHVRYAAPITIPRDASEEELESLRLRAESELNRITDQVDAEAGAAEGEARS
ncbi:MAG: DUF374 domain-containing protein [Gemmatimonadales bacterium]|nr:MAG: DUF374 domain-containing protein [Gemmatimonadales bacterium]